MCLPAEHPFPSACNQGWYGRGRRARQASGIKDHMMQEEIKSKPIIQNFTCTPRESGQGDIWF